MVTQSSNVATSLAIPGETGDTVGSMVGCLSITSSLVSVRVPVLRKDSATDRGRNDATPFLETDEGVDPRWIVIGEGGAGNGDETPAVAKAR